MQIETFGKKLYFYITNVLMKKIGLFIFMLLLVTSACNDQENDNNKLQDSEDEFLLNNEELESPEEKIVEEDNGAMENIDNYPETYQFDLSDSSGVIYAKFRSAYQVEGDVSLHFNVFESRKHVDFYYFDIDPVKEGLFTYKEIEGSAFSELVTNPEINNYLLTLYWVREHRQLDLSDEYGDVPVLIRIEKEDISDVYD